MFFSLLRRALLLIFAAQLASMALAQEADLKSAVESFDASLSQAWEGAGIDAFSNLYTEDAIYWTPLGDTLTGRDAIKAWLAQLGPTQKLVIEPLHYERVGDHIFVVGNFVQDIEYQGKQLHYRGGYVMLLVEGPEGQRMRRLISFPERKPTQE